MPYRKFVAHNVFGGIFWVLAMTVLGYFLGRAIPNIQQQIHLVIVVVIFLSLLPGIIKFLRERWKVNRAP